ncbi:MAG: class I SAM-dependent methyltransferase [Spirochaetales bacterium]|nr:class I SAM-dependent methyltransferase [Spirochaetales bacterium]
MKKEYYDNYVTSISRQIHACDENEYGKTSAYFNTYISRFLPKNRNAAICDLGCGPGFFLYYLQQKAYTNIRGVDISKEQIAICKRMELNEVYLDDGIKYLKRNKNKFDICFSSNVMEHISKAVFHDFLKRIYESLKTKGKVILIVPNAAPFFSTFNLYFDITHERLFTAASLKQAFLTAGFKEVSVHSLLPREKGLFSLLRRYLFIVLIRFSRLLLINQIGLKAYRRFQPVYFTNEIIGIAEKK